MRQRSAEIQLNNNNLEQITRLNFEDKQSVVGFFDLLLRIDKRINPKMYEDNGSTIDAN